MTTADHHPLRVLTFDECGVIKVIQGGATKEPKEVESWGHREASKWVLAASLIDQKNDPLLAVARNNGTIELCDPLSGRVYFTIPDVTNNCDPFVGIHLFTKQHSQASRLLSCTNNGKLSIRSFNVADSSSKPLMELKMKATDFLTCKVDESERYFLFGGKRDELKIWDLEYSVQSWPKIHPDSYKNTVWYTSANFLTKDDLPLFVVGTNSHQVHMYDTRNHKKTPCRIFDIQSARARTGIAVNTPIQALTVDQDGFTIYIGNGSGNLASIDTRTGKVLGCFLGEGTGSIRSLANHPELPLIASGGVDNFLSIWDVKTRTRQFQVRVDHHLTNVIFHSNFSGEEARGAHSASFKSVL